MSNLPVLFVSHGAPLLAVTDGPAHRFLRELGTNLPRPRAIVVASAHWETPSPRVTGNPSPNTIHDFGGFPRELYELRYAAPGSVEIAQRVVAELRANGFADSAADETRGFDHGAWVPLMLMYPQADVPVLQVSLRIGQGAEAHYQLGRALGALRDDDVLLMGSGSATHNLMEIGMFAFDQPPPKHVHEFNEWLASTVTRGDWPSMANYLANAPYARRNHPTEEHFVPLAFAWGAAGDDAKGERIHSSYTYGSLSMDAYLFQ